MRLTLCFLSLELTCNFGWAEEENFSVNENIVSVAALEGLPSSIIGGSVCAISGLYIDHSTDFVLPGPESLIFERIYSAILKPFMHGDIQLSYMFKGLQRKDF